MKIRKVSKIVLITAGVAGVVALCFSIKKGKKSVDDIAENVSETVEEIVN